MQKSSAIILASVLLAGCATGIDGGGKNPTATFRTEVGYQEAYRRVAAQAEACTKGTVTGNVFTDNQTAELRSTGNFISPIVMEKAEIKQTPEGTMVTVTMWGNGGWGSRHIEAVRQSVIQGRTICASDLPK